MTTIFGHRSFGRMFTVVAAHSGQSPREVLEGLMERSSLINRYERVTGDAILYVGEKLVKGAGRMKSAVIHEMFRQFIDQQVLRPEYFAKQKPSLRPVKDRVARRILQSMFRDVWNLRSGL